MNEQQLMKKKRLLEERNHQLQRELIELDRIMRTAGFSNGLETVKSTAQELASFNDEGEEYAA